MAPLEKIGWEKNMKEEKKTSDQVETVAYIVEGNSRGVAFPNGPDAGCPGGRGWRESYP